MATDPFKLLPPAPSTAFFSPLRKLLPCPPSRHSQFSTVSLVWCLFYQLFVSSVFSVPLFNFPPHFLDIVISLPLLKKVKIFTSFFCGHKELFSSLLPHITKFMFSAFLISPFLNSRGPRINPITVMEGPVRGHTWINVSIVPPRKWKEGMDNLA